MSEAQWWAAYAEAKRVFADIPGVSGVGLGIKETNHALTGDVAVIVYVEEKKVPENLRDSEHIPSSVAGVKTDVQTSLEFDALGGTTIDGGAQIRRTPDGRDRPKPGTLGYISTKTSNDENVMLSCDHVMLSRRQADKRIFHPDVSRCCGKLKNAVGGVIEGRVGHVPFTNAHGPDDYFIDAAIASIDDGINARKFIPNVGQINGSGDLTATPAGPGGQSITVKKRGAATDVTEGTVDDVAYPFAQFPGAPTAYRVIKIRPKSGGTFPFSITWQVPPVDVAGHVANFPGQSLGGTATQVASDKVRFDVPVFAIPGDSGAAVVEAASGNIVGLVFSGSIYRLAAFKDGRLGTGIVPTGFAVACHIPPILGELGIRIDPSTAPSAGRGAVLPGNEITPEPPDRLRQINARLAAIEVEFDASPTARRLNNLVRQHADELVDLVHHRRRVTVAWHRYQGPAFSALLLESIVDSERDLPTAANGVPREELLMRMRKVLDTEGSPSLRAALADNEAFLLDILDASRTIDELVENLS